MGVFKTRTRWYYQGRQVSVAEAKRLQDAGQRVEKRTERSAIWRIRFRHPITGRLIEEPAYTDKQASLELLKKRRQQAEREAVGLASPADRHLLDAVGKHLADFQHDLETRGRTAKHIRLTLSRIRAVLDAISCQRLADLQPGAVRDAIWRMNVATETKNHHLIAIKALTRWLWKQTRLPADPLAGLSRWNAEPDRRVRRRAPSPEELGRLIASTEQSSRVFRGLTGRDRAAIYLLASFSGLRASELGSLTLASMDFDTTPPTVTVEAAYSKHKRQDVVPIPPAVAEYLQGWLSSRSILPGPGVRLWPGTWPKKAAKMIRQDLEEAGIPFETDSGRVDFHSLRVFYATQLARQGINLQTARVLMRHSHVELTAKTYTKLGIADVGEVVKNLTIPTIPGQGERQAQS